MGIIIPDGFELVPTTFDEIITKDIPIHSIIGLSDWDRMILKNLYLK